MFLAEILSFAASIAATVLGIFEPFNRKMSTVLIFNFLGNLLVGVSYLLVGGMSGALICLVAGVQIVINYIFSIKSQKVPLWLMLIYAGAFTAVNLISFSVWYDIFSLGAALSFVWSVAQPDPKYYRIFLAVNVSMWVVYDILAKAYGNLLVHVVCVITIAAAIYVRDFRKKNGTEDEHEEA